MRSNPERLVPVGVWIRLRAPALPEPLVAFTYVDPQAGLSAAGSLLHEGEPRHVIARLVPAPPGDWEEVPEAERAALGLSTPPDWAAHYGPQPPRGMLWGAWRSHPGLRGKFHPAHPDDLQVLVHDGGPRLTRTPPELVWARVTALEGDRFTATVLNAPRGLRTVALHDSIRFIVPARGPHPVQVTERYLRERPGWRIHACQGCGFTEILDPPSELIRVLFPDPPAGGPIAAFSAFCGLCGGVQIAERV